MLKILQVSKRFEPIMLETGYKSAHAAYDKSLMLIKFFRVLKRTPTFSLLPHCKANEYIRFDAQ